MPTATIQFTAGLLMRGLVRGFLEAENRSALANGIRVKVFPNLPRKAPMTTETQTKSIQFAIVAALALGAPLEGGTFAGVITLPNGTHAAVVLLADKPSEELNWADAKKWAESVGGELPARPAAAMLFANAKDQFDSEWHWTSEAYSGSHAWIQYFDDGGQVTGHVDGNDCARAVRMIPLVL